MATRPNFGKGRNLRLHMIDETTEAAVILAVNNWLESLKEQEIISIDYQCMVYGSPSVEHHHIFIIYTEE